MVNGHESEQVGVRVIDGIFTSVLVKVGLLKQNLSHDSGQTWLLDKKIPPHIKLVNDASSTISQIIEPFLSFSWRPVCIDYKRLGT